jgi:hypothetical protein
LNTISLWSLRFSYAFAALFVLVAVVQYLQGSEFIGLAAKTLQTLLGTTAAIGIAARGYLLRQADEDLAKQYTRARSAGRAARRRAACT